MQALHWSTSGYPADWLTEITVTRAGGTDAFGDDLPIQIFVLDHVLVGFNASRDADEWNDQPDDQASLYIEPGRFTFQQADLITVPDGPWASGRWQIDGRAVTGPLGTEVPLRRRI